MKNALLTCLAIVCIKLASAQAPFLKIIPPSSKPAPFTHKYKPGPVPEKSNKARIQKPQSDLFPGTPSHAAKNGRVYVMPTDQMPCVAMNPLLVDPHMNNNQVSKNMLLYYYRTQPDLFRNKTWLIW